MDNSRSFLDKHESLLPYSVSLFLTVIAPTGYKVRPALMEKQNPFSLPSLFSSRKISPTAQEKK
jgi:hypothetical protein